MNASVYDPLLARLPLRHVLFVRHVRVSHLCLLGFEAEESMNMSENSMVVGATAEYERRNPEVTQADYKNALDEIINGDWCGDNLPGKLGDQFSAMAEAVRTKADDAKLARMARYMVQLATEHIVEQP
jgi:hypothetical protein